MDFFLDINQTKNVLKYKSMLVLMGSLSKLFSESTKPYLELILLI